MTVNLIFKIICSKPIKKENKIKAKTLLDRKKINLILTSLIFNIVYENVICHTFRKTLQGNYICHCLFLGGGGKHSSSELWIQLSRVEVQDMLF